MITYLGKPMEIFPQCGANGWVENQALGFENEKAAENILSGQCIEGISAFLEKRTPKWKS